MVYFSLEAEIKTATFKKKIFILCFFMVEYIDLSSFFSELKFSDLLEMHHYEKDVLCWKKLLFISLDLN